MSSINNRYIFWSNDPTVLYKDKNYLEFFPTSEMTRIEQLNAITRFCIYFIILIYLFGKSEGWMHVGVIVILLVYIFYIIFENDQKGLTQELYRMKNTNLEKFIDESNDVDRYATIDDDYIIEAGTYDENGKLVFGKYQGSHDGKINKINYSLEELEKYKRATCRQPTPDNPFMNPTINDFGLEIPPDACNIDDEDIQNKMIDAFNADLFRDVSDLFDRQNSQRQYYTVPHANPPDTIALANWLYKPDGICKVDQTKCLRYEDLRYKR